MRCFAIGFMVLGLVGCDRSGGTDAAQAEARIEKCVERFLNRVAPGSEASEQGLRRYVESTYCARFEGRGWVYDDGALSIGAQEWLETAGSEECATAGSGQASSTIPCEELRAPETPRIIDCALLHHVRRSEVREYLENLRSQNEIECDDGTPLEELGA